MHKFKMLFGIITIMLLDSFNYIIKIKKTKSQGISIKNIAKDDKFLDMLF